MIRRPGGLLEEKLTYSIIGSFFEVHRILRFGFVEPVYLSALERELLRKGHSVARELSVRVLYRGEEIAWQRLDMVVDGKVVVEAKATEILPAIAERQLYNYLSATRLEVGLLLHFGPQAEYRRVFVPNDRPPNDPSVIRPVRSIRESSVRTL